MSDSGDVIKIDQEHLETVIPALGTCNALIKLHLNRITSNSSTLGARICSLARYTCLACVAWRFSTGESAITNPKVARSLGESLKHCGRIVSVLISGPSSPSFSPGQGRCVMFKERHFSHSAPPHLSLASQV